MKPDQNNDWIEAMRHSLRDAELPPPADGWARLQQELHSTAPAPVAAPASRSAKRPAWKIIWPRVAAAAAAVLIGVVAGNLLLRPNRVLVENGDVIASAGDSAATVAPMPPQSAGTTLQTTLAEAVGLSEERPAAPSSSIRTQTLLAAATAADRAPEVRAVGSEAFADGLREVLEPPVPVSETVPEAAQLADRPLPAVGEPSDRARRAKQTGKPAGDDYADAATRAAAERAAATSGDSRYVPESRDEAFASHAPRRERASFSVHAGGGLSGGNAGNAALPGMQMSVSNDLSSAIGTGDNMTFVQRFDAGDNTYRHHQPLSFGLSVSKAFPYGLSLESGVIYTLVLSDVRTRYASEEVSQKLHFIGVPLRLNWQFFERGRFSLYAGAGGLAEKCVSAKFGTTTVNEPGLQWSALAAVGLQYRLGNVVGLYFEPEGSYYFTQTRLRTVRTESPLTLSLRLGVRLSF